MPYFDKFDICEAYLAIEIHYNLGGWLQERPSNQRRREATHVQLHRMNFRPAPTRLDCFDALTENGQEIYQELERRYGFVDSRPPGEGDPLAPSLADPALAPRLE